MYRLGHARSNIVSFLTEQKKFPEWRNIIYRIWVTSVELKSAKIIFNKKCLLYIHCWQIKTKQSESGHFTFWNCYIQGAPQKKQSHCFLHRALKTSRKVDFGGCPLDKLYQIKNTGIRTLYILKLIHSWNCYIQGVHERSNKTAFFAEHMKVQEKSTFADALWINCSKLK